MQPVELGPTEGEVIPALPGPPWIWVTLGTVFNDRPDAWDPLLEGSSDGGLPVVATAGAGHDRAPTGAGNVVVLPFAPASVLLEGSEAVVCHAGAGTMLGALRHGVPMVLVPQGADQFHNARECARVGAAEVLDGAKLRREDVARALRSVLEEDRYRRAAQMLSDEIRAMPSPEATVGVLERLAAGRPPA
jgi:UDP:flavonoid glycosyltransferase YjiC (YdhE family)